MKHQSCFRVVEMACIDLQLLRRFIESVLTVAKHNSISDEKRHRHEYAIAPQLPLATLTRRMPETSIRGSRISIKSSSDTIGRKLVSIVFRLFVHEENEISRKHAVEVVELYFGLLSFAICVGHDSIIIDMRVDTSLDVVKIFPVSGAFVNQVLAVQIERLRVSPRAEIRRSWESVHRRVDHRDRPINLRPRLQGSRCCCRTRPLE